MSLKYAETYHSGAFFFIHLCFSLAHLFLNLLPLLHRFSGFLAQVWLVSSLALCPPLCGPIVRVFLGPLLGGLVGFGVRGAHTKLAAES